VLGPALHQQRRSRQFTETQGESKAGAKVTTEHWLAVAIGFFWLQVLICYFTYKRGFGDGFLKGWIDHEKERP